jgi:hypothetical protein
VRGPTCSLDVHGSVHHNINHIEKPTKCDRVVEFMIPLFLNCLTCLERHAAHHQEFKTVIAAFGFTYVCGCRQLSWLSGNSAVTAADNHKRM